MKRFLLFNLFLLFAFSSPGLALVGNLILGLSAPQGSFGQAELDNEQAGFCQDGFAAAWNSRCLLLHPCSMCTASVLYVQNKLGSENRKMILPECSRKSILACRPTASQC
jgi:hypothetical protein